MEDPWAWQRSWHSAQRFQIRGVLSNDRQETIENLLALGTRGHRVLIFLEPNNAVAVRTMDGLRLGHVASELAGNFRDGVYIGSIDSIGQVPDKDILGVRVVVEQLKPVMAVPLGWEYDGEDTRPAGWYEHLPTKRCTTKSGSTLSVKTVAFKITASKPRQVKSEVKCEVESEDSN